jgi:hypothetical protein
MGGAEEGIRVLDQEGDGMAALKCGIAEERMKECRTIGSGKVGAEAGVKGAGKRAV